MLFVDCVDVVVFDHVVASCVSVRVLFFCRGVFVMCVD